MSLFKPPFGARVNRSHPLSKGLIACYLMNEGGGLYVRDIANRNTGTLTNIANPASATSGWYLGDSLRFDGTDDYVRVPHSTTLAISNQEPIALVALVNPSVVTTYGTILIKGRDVLATTLNYCYRQNVTGKKLEFYYTAGAGNWQIWGTTADVFPTANVYYHVVVTGVLGTGSSIKCYINGVEAAGGWILGTGNTAPDTPAEDLMIGRLTTSEFFAGIIKYVYIYKRTLTATDVRQLYNNPYVIVGGNIGIIKKVGQLITSTSNFFFGA